MTKSVYVVEYETSILEGGKRTFSVVWEGGTTAASSDAKVFMNSGDITSTAMPSGSHTQAANVSTFKQLVAGTSDGDEVYVVVFQSTVDGDIRKKKMLVNIVKVEDE